MYKDRKGNSGRGDQLQVGIPRVGSLLYLFQSSKETTGTVTTEMVSRKRAGPDHVGLADCLWQDLRIYTSWGKEAWEGFEEESGKTSSTTLKKSLWFLWN